jgi:DNA-binding MarR family transcriptional regulator
MKHHHDIAWQDLLDRILELTVVLADDMERDLQQRGLTRSRTQVLWLVTERGPMTQRALADAIGVSPRNITGLVDGLVETGFVTREPHPDDRRATLVTLTDRGIAAGSDLRHAHAELARLLFEGMPAKRLEEFRKGLDHVLGVVRAATANLEPVVGGTDSPSRAQDVDPVRFTHRKRDDRDG